MNDEAPRDAPLVEAALAGDRDAFGQLVLRYQDRLFNTLLRIVGSHEDAADAVQDALLQAYLKLDSFRGASQFYTWMYRIATNVALSRARRRKRTVSLDGVKESIGEEPVDETEPPDKGLLTEEQRNQVQAALADLDVEHRTVIALREFEEFSYEEIAEILEVPVGTVRSRLHRARAELKERLKTTWDEEAEAVK